MTGLVLAAVAACALSSGSHNVYGPRGDYQGRVECQGQKIVVKDARDSLQLTIEVRGRAVRVTDPSGRLVMEVR